jgi:hypothetical protein
MLTFSWSPDAKVRAEAIDRFQKNRGLATAGMKLLGRWTRADLSGGFDLLETDDPRKLTEFAYAWSDLMDLEITPVLDDHELKDALQAAMK